MKGSKPESTPDWLVPFVSMAIDLSEVQSIGGRFSYPDGLTAVEWESLKALNRGRGEADTLAKKRDEKKK